MRLKTECLFNFIGYYKSFRNGCFINESFQAIKCQKILRLTRRARRIFLEDYNHVQVDLSQASPGRPYVIVTLTKDTKSGKETESVDSRLYDVEPVDILWFIPYVDRLRIKEYGGDLIKEDTTESESKKQKYDDDKSVWGRYVEVTTRLIKSLKNVELERITCDLSQIKLLSGLLTAKVWNISNDDFRVERHDKLLNIGIWMADKCFGKFLQLAFGTKCDDIEKLEIEFIGDYEERRISDIPRFQGYFPELREIVLHWDQEYRKLGIVKDLMASRLERPLKITITSDDCCPEYDELNEAINLLMDWSKMDPNVTIKLCITDVDEIEEDLSNETLEEFEKTVGSDGNSNVYTFDGDRLKIIVNEPVFQDSD